MTARNPNTACPSPGRRLLLRKALALGGLGLAMPGVKAWGELRWPSVKADIRARYPSVEHVSVKALHGWLQDHSRRAPLLLDTRAADEFSRSHLPGALHAPNAEVALDLIAKHGASRPVVLYCSVGERSSAMAQQLRRGSGDRVMNLEGSIFEWADAGLPLECGGIAKPCPVHPFNRRWGSLLRRERWSHEP